MKAFEDWHHQYPKGVPVSIDIFKYETVNEWLSFAYLAHADQTAYRQGNTLFTFEQIKKNVQAFRTVLFQSGLGKGKRIGIFASTCVAQLIGILAIIESDAELVLLESTIEADKLREQIVLAQLDALLLDADAVGSLRLLQKQDALQWVFTINKRDFTSGWHLSAIRKQLKLPGHLKICRMANACKKAYKNPVALQSQSSKDSKSHFCYWVDVSVGQVKSFSQGNFVAAILQQKAWFKPVLKSKTHQLFLACQTPQPAALASMLYAFGQGFMQIGCKYKDIESMTLWACGQAQASILVFESTNFDQLCKSKRLKKLATCPPRLLLVVSQKATTSEQRMLWRGTVGINPTDALLFEGMIVVANPQLSEGKLGSHGLPIPLTEIKILSPNGTPLPSGQQGCLWIRCPQVGTHYWLAVEHLIADENTWQKSKYQAIIDWQGFLFVSIPSQQYQV